MSAYTVSKNSLDDDVSLKVLELLLRDPYAPLSITLSGPGVVNGLDVQKTIKLLRNTEKLLKAIASENSPNHRIEVKVKGIDNAGESFTVRFEILDQTKPKSRQTPLSQPPSSESGNSFKGQQATPSSPESSGRLPS